MTQSDVIYGAQLAVPCPICNADCLGSIDVVEDSDELTCDNCPAVQTNNTSHAIVHLSVTELPALGQNAIKSETVIPIGELDHHNDDYAALSDTSGPTTVIKGLDAAAVKGGTVFVPVPDIDVGNLDD